MESEFKLREAVHRMSVRQETKSQRGGFACKMRLIANLRSSAQLWRWSLFMGAIALFLVLLVFYSKNIALSIWGAESSGRSETSKRSEGQEDQARAKRTRTTEHGPQPRDARLVSLFGNMPTPHKIGDFDEYLKKCQRSSKGLGIAFLLCRDESLLAELRLRTNDPEACATLAMWSPVKGERLGFASRLYELDTKNSFAGMILANALGKTGDWDRATLILTSDFDSSRFMMKGYPEKSDYLEAWMTMKSDPVEAWAQAEASEPRGEVRSYSTELYSSLKEISQRVISNAKMLESSEGEIATTNAAPKLIGLAQSIGDFNLTKKWQTMDVIGSNLVKNILTQMPGDWEYGEGGQTISEYLQTTVGAGSLATLHNQEFTMALLRAKPDVVDRFVKKVMESGENEAKNWMIDQVK